MLSPDQRAAYESQGYFRLPAMLPADLLARLRALFDELLDPDDAEGKVVLEQGGRRLVTNLGVLCNKGNLACLELLGYPPMLELAQAICGPDFFLIQEFAVIKHRGDGVPVLWHQDMVHGRTGACFTLGIYLDDADAADGALQVVPGSHTSGRKICELMHEPCIDVPMRAGDWLMHDMMLAHGSGPAEVNPLRRVIYFEFLSAAHALGETIYTQDLIERRTRLLFAATRLHQIRNPDTPPFRHDRPNPDPGDQAKEIETIVEEIYSAPINARPSAYCIMGTSVFSDPLDAKA